MILQRHRKNVFIGLVLVFLFFIIVFSVALVQLRQQEIKVANQRGISEQTAVSFRALTAPDGLFNFPELGDTNTLESRIDATFKVSEMAKNTDYAVATDKTRDSLYSYVQNEQKPLDSRLKAYVALRNFKDQRWQEWEKLALRIDSALPATVSEDGVSDFLAIAEPVALLNDNYQPRAKLLLFDPLADEKAESTATSTLISDYLFANGDEIRQHFAGLEPTLCTLASGESDGAQKPLLAANALMGTEKSNCINNEYIRGLYGCKDSEQLVSVDGKPSSVCSLSLTYSAYRLGISK